MPVWAQFAFVLHIVSSGFAPEFAKGCRLCMTNGVSYCLPVFLATYDSPLRAARHLLVTNWNAALLFTVSLVCFKPLGVSQVSTEYVSAWSLSMPEVASGAIGASRVAGAQRTSPQGVASHNSR